jgi:hypothetical protein
LGLARTKFRALNPVPLKPLFFFFAFTIRINTNHEMQLHDLRELIR